MKGVQELKLVAFVAILAVKLALGAIDLWHERPRCRVKGTFLRQTDAILRCAR
jgi:hypothetical protein